MAKKKSDPEASTTATIERHQVADLPDLVHSVELSEVRTYKVSAERTSNDLEDIEETQRDIVGMVRVEPEFAEFRFQMTVTAPNVDYFVDLSTVFSYLRPIETPDDDIVSDFLGQVALMAAFPYLRETVSGLAGRLGVDVPVIGVLRRGDIQFGRSAGSE